MRIKIAILISTAQIIVSCLPIYQSVAFASSSGVKACSDLFLISDTTQFSLPDGWDSSRAIIGLNNRFASKGNSYFNHIVMQLVRSWGKFEQAFSFQWQTTDALTTLLFYPKPEHYAWFKREVGLDKNRIRQLVAIAYVNAVFHGKDPRSSAVYTDSMLAWEASLLGASLERIETVYRWDQRSPEQIIAAKGFFPRTRESQFGLWAHTIFDNMSGSLVSTTLKEGNPEIANMISNVFSKETPHTIYEYEVGDVHGVRTPPEFGVAAEEEVVITSATLHQIRRYREVYCDQYGRIKEFGPWTSM